MISFASDNNSGVHPKIMAALEQANLAHAPSYGEDEYSAKAQATIRSIFGDDCRSFFVFIGTASNVLAISSTLKPYEAVICADTAHIHTDECGAMEAAGRKLYPVPGRNGKISPAEVAPLLNFVGDVHHACPKMVSITQSTELGTLYSPEEISELSKFCREHGLYLHMDGARLSNAAVALGLGLREASRDLGVDILSLGGTKNGLMYGELVLFFRPELGQDFAFYRKQQMQLGSKARYLAAQFEAYLKDGLWRENASNANNMAALLAEELQKIPGVELVSPCRVNSVFVSMPRQAVEKVQAQYPFYIWSQTHPSQGGNPVIRLMTNFDSRAEDIENFVTTVRNALNS